MYPFKKILENIAFFELQDTNQNFENKSFYEMTILYNFMGKFKISYIFSDTIFKRKMLTFK